MKLLIALSLILQVTAVPVEIYVCCGCGDDTQQMPTTQSTALNTLSAAFDISRSLRLASEETYIILSGGPCAPPRRLEAMDGGRSESERVVVRSLGSAPTVISGGVPLMASSLSPVTDPSILAQIQPAARAFVQQVDLAALGYSNLGSLACHPYMGGEASILPGNLVPSGMELFAFGNPFTGGDASPLNLARYPNIENLPRQWSSGSVNAYTIFPDSATAGRLALWAQQLAEDPDSIYVHYLGGLEWDDHVNSIASISPSSTSAAAASAAPTNCSYEDGFDYTGNDVVYPIFTATVEDCCAYCQTLPNCSYFSYCTNDACGNHPCYLKNSSSGRQPWANRLSGPHLPSPPAASLTLNACPSHYAQPGFDSLDNAGTFYTYNLLSELDQEGEYYINRTSQMLYVWLPTNASSPVWQTAPWGLPIAVPLSETLRPVESAHRQAVAEQLANASDTMVGILSINDTLVDLLGASYITFDNIVFTFSRDATIALNGSTGITISNAIIENSGSMALNATGGSNLLVEDSVIRHAGNGAVFLYAGDRVTLTSSNHTILNTTLSYSNRYMYCYVPMVAMGDCGNAVLGSEMFGGPHQGIFMSGNNHRLEGNQLHDLVQAASDSGAVYMGRDFTYQGSTIHNNTFLRINTVDPSDDVSAVYLDDEVSGFSIIGNTFINVSRAMLLGGGRSNLFIDNIINYTANTAVAFDNRGMGWAQASCTPPSGELIGFLSRVPYNTSAVWIQSFPQLVTILDDEPCVPKYNVLVNNAFCDGVSIDQSNSTITSWGSTAWGNTGTC